jgi:hypothetical protein
MSEIDPDPLQTAAAARSSVTKPHRPLACAACQQRKVKCDRKFPCNTCVRSRVQCIPVSAPRQRRRRFPEADLLQRVRHLEDLLRQHNIDFEPLHGIATSAEQVEVRGAERDKGSPEIKTETTFEAKCVLSIHKHEASLIKLLQESLASHEPTSTISSQFITNGGSTNRRSSVPQPR